MIWVSTTATNTEYKVAFTVNDNVKVEVLAETLDEVFKSSRVHYNRTIENLSIIYTTNYPKDYALMWKAIIYITDSEILPYFKSVIWTDYDYGYEYTEDVIAGKIAWDKKYGKIKKKSLSKR